jgi:hypothetical protein
MDIPKTNKIMRALANGKNPETGDRLENRSMCTHPQTVKALNRGISALVHEQKREQRKPTNAFGSWTRAEAAQVCQEVRNGTDPHDIAKSHNRTLPSMVARLVKLGKITAMAMKAA